MGGVSESRLDFATLHFNGFLREQQTSSTTIFIIAGSRIGLVLAFHQGIKSIPPVVEWDIDQWCPQTTNNG
jgi:hypothetical protein